MPSQSIAIKNSVSGYQIEVSAKRVRQFFKQVLRTAKANVTIDQWVILQALEKANGSSQLDLCKAVYKDQPTVTRMIDLMVEKKLLTRKADKMDRRRFQIFLTPKGRTAITKINPLVDDFRAIAFNGIPKAQLHQFQLTLQTIFNNLASE